MAKRILAACPYCGKDASKKCDHFVFSERATELLGIHDRDLQFAAGFESEEEKLHLLVWGDLEGSEKIKSDLCIEDLDKDEDDESGDDENDEVRDTGLKVVFAESRDSFRQELITLPLKQRS